jgi:7-keto-8-aminopelargonate synthetase-like enzyme
MHAGNKRGHLWENSRRLHKGLRDLGFDLATPEAQSAIIAILLPDQDTTVRMWQALLEAGRLRQHGPSAGHSRRHVPAALLALRRP